MIRFRAAFVVSVLVALSVACGSSTDAGDKPGSFDPAISVLTLEVPRARPSTAQQFTTMVKIAIINRSSEPVTVERIDIESVGTGPFNLLSSTRTFNQVLEPRREGIYQVFAQANVNVAEEAISRSEGMIFVRGVALFKTSTGSTRKVFVQRVGTTMGTVTSE